VELSPGTKVGEHLQVVRVLGRGITTIYEARDLRSGELMVVNELPIAHNANEVLIERLRTEVATLEKLSHTGIPRYISHQLVLGERGRRFYWVQELGPGKSLDILIREGWRPSEPDARAIALHVLDILSYLHTHRPPVIHCDLRPENILRDEENRIHLVNLGNVEQAYVTLSGVSRPLGAMGYVAPEVVRSRPQPASDLYGLGASLVHILTQSAPARLPQSRLKINLRHHTAASEAFAAFVDALQEPIPEDRIQSANDAINALRMSGGAQLRRADETPAKGKRGAWSGPSVEPGGSARFWIGLCVVLGLALGVMTFLYLKTRFADKEPDAPTARAGDQRRDTGAPAPGPPTKQPSGAPAPSTPTDPATRRSGDQLQPPIKANFALRFVDQDTFQTERIAKLNPGRSLTLEAWFFIRDGKRHEQTLAPRLRPMIVLFTLDAGTLIQLKLYKKTLIFGDGDTVRTPSVVRYGVWHHVAGVYDHKIRALQIYLDGKVLGSVGGVLKHAAVRKAAMVSAGGRVSSVTGMDVALPAFNITMDELRYWGYARTAEQIRGAMKHELSGLEKGLLGYWSFNSGKGQQVVDYTPNKHHGHRGSDPGRKDNDDPAWVRQSPFLR
jgi:serine/threonine protein kinase